MKSFLFVILSVLATALCWGTYGPILHEGQIALGDSRMRAFMMVGVAYFIIAVLVPVLWLWWRGEKGAWTAKGLIWSTAAGIVTSIGALGIILAFAFKGNPVYVMPLVFGGAPVVNTFYTMTAGRTYRQAGPLFFAGLILVIVGAVTVLVFKPQPERGQHVAAHATEAEAKAPAADAAVETPRQGRMQRAALSAEQMLLVGLSIATTCVCWGTYGPILHNGQVAMQGSRMRPFICVGLAYFLVAVLGPIFFLAIVPESGEFTFRGVVLSLIAGALGAFGSLGIIMAFNFGGKPIYVMPLVFGGAPVINTFVTLMHGVTGPISPFFYAGLIVVVTGAVTVLVFAPKGGPTPASHAPPRKPEPPRSEPPKAAPTT